jgi:cyclopropane fatty-acyl-phospholipid synthase-like methyltransferase
MRSSPKDFASETQRIQAYWQERAQLAQNDSQRVDSSRRAQRMRFEAFILNHELGGKSILDLGCGVGDLWEHLCKRGIECEYFGMDLSPEMVRRCQERFPGIAFESANVLEWKHGRQFDYVVSFGIHNNVRLENGRQILQAVTARQFELCRIGAHVSLLTDRYPPGFASHMQPWNAEDILKLALEITPYVVLRHDYLPNDFSVTLYREPMIDTRKDLILV